MIYFYILTFLCSSVHEAVTEPPRNLACGERGECSSTPLDCNEICGCDKIYIYNETVQQCVLNMEYFKQVTERYHSEEKLRIESDRVFGGILVAAFIFISCASLCVLSACIYCCRIHYTDNKLHNELKALANKLNRDGKFKKSLKKPIHPVAESCNVVVGDAGVFVC